MLGDVIHFVVEHHLVAVTGTRQIEGDVRKRIRLYLYIRRFFCDQFRLCNDFRFRLRFFTFSNLFSDFHNFGS